MVVSAPMTNAGTGPGAGIVNRCIELLEHKGTPVHPVTSHTHHITAAARASPWAHGQTHNPPSRPPTDRRSRHKAFDYDGLGVLDPRNELREEAVAVQRAPAQSD